MILLKWYVALQIKKGQSMTKIDMTTGDIKSILLKVSVPIIASNLMKTAFGFIDMLLVARIGSNAVVAVGTANFFIHLAFAISSIVVVGTGIKVSQSVGLKDDKKAKEYIKTSLLLGLIISLIFCFMVLIFHSQLIGFFRLDNELIVSMAKSYLLISLIGMPFMMLTLIINTILTSYGNTKLSFKMNTIGFIINIIISPMLIFGFMFIPALGVTGAAISTVIGRVITFILLLIYGFEYINFGNHIKCNLKKAKDILFISMPATFQRVMFSLISMYMGRLVVSFGSHAMAAQRIGLQIEAISYMTIGALQSGILAFVGQNYANNKIDRIKEGYFISLKFSIIFGLIVSLIFIVFPYQLFSLFVAEEDVIFEGINYMRIIAISQIFMCIELLTVGAFNGFGKTYRPSIVSIVFTTSRIPIAIVLSKYYGVSGVWMSISITSIFKGIILLCWFLSYINKYKKE